MFRPLLLSPRAPWAKAVVDLGPAAAQPLELDQNPATQGLLLRALAPRVREGMGAGPMPPERLQPALDQAIARIVRRWVCSGEGGENTELKKMPWPPCRSSRRQAVLGVLSAGFVNASSYLLEKALKRLR